MKTNPMNTIKDQVKKTKVQVALSLAIAVAASLAPEEAVSHCVAGNQGDCDVQADGSFDCVYGSFWNDCLLY